VSDESGQTPASGGEQTSDSGRPVNAAAAAASRARRIGGRVRASGTEPDAETQPVAKPAATSAAKPADLRKSAKSEKALSKPRVRAGGPTASRGSGGRTAWLPAGILSAGAVAALVVLLLSAFGGKSTSATAQRDQVLAAAKACVAASNSYSYKSLDSFERKGLACGTGTFATKFKSSVDQILKKNAPTVKQVQTFQVNTAGIIETTATTWGVLIYGQVHVVNVGTGSDGRTDPYGAIAVMVRKNGSWKLSQLNTLCSSTLSASGNACV